MMFRNSQQTDFRRNSFFAPPPRHEQHFYPEQQGMYDHNGHSTNSPPYYSSQIPYGQPYKEKGINGTIMSYFTKEDGTLDYEKIGNGVIQVYGIAGKVVPLVKNLSPLLSVLKK